MTLLNQESSSNQHDNRAIIIVVSEHLLSHVYAFQSVKLVDHVEIWTYRILFFLQSKQQAV